MLKADVAREGIRRFTGQSLCIPVRCIHRLLRRVHDRTDPVNGNAHLRHLRDHPSEGADRPDQHAVVGGKGDKVTLRDHTAHTEDGAEHDRRQRLES